MKPHPERAWRSVQVLISLVFISLWLVQGCGGSGGVDSGGTGAAPPTLAVGPISGYGSIVVAGVHDDETNAHIVDGDDQPLNASALRVGTAVAVHGQIDSAGSRNGPHALSRLPEPHVLSCARRSAAKTAPPSA